MALSEFDIIRQILAGQRDTDSNLIVPAGDDAAVLKIDDGNELVISMDTLVSGVHFFSDASPEDIGYKSLAVNLSDLAAMSATPHWFSLSLTLPESDMQWVEDFCRGLYSLAKRFDLSLIGGDLTQGPLNISIQVHGLIKKGRAILRSGARPEHVIYVSNRLGEAALGLDVVKKSITKKEFELAINRLNRPEPQVQLGIMLMDYASSMIDLSDGLAGDLNHICQASGVGALINLDDIPLPQVDTNDYGNDDLLKFALFGGDDYELCFTVPPEHSDSLEKEAEENGFSIKKIGHITAGCGVNFLDSGGGSIEFKRSSFQHF